MRTNQILLGFLLCSLAACSDDNPPQVVTGRPIFAGLVSVAPNRGGQLVLRWNAATDETTTADRLVYRIYASTKEGKSRSFAPKLSTLPGATTAILDAVPTGARHYVTVRAVDEAGNEDTNTVELSTVAVGDAAPPAFNGIAQGEPLGDAGVRLSWDDAIDDHTPKEAMRYEIFSGPATGSVDFSKVIATSEPGARKIELKKLGKPGEARLFAVRARDVGDNAEANTKSIPTSLGPDVVPPIFGGCGNVVATSPKSLAITWSEGRDDYSPPSALTYDVYLGTSSGGQAFQGSPAASVTGSTSTTIGNLVPGQTYFVVCRARDAAANQEENKAERTVTMASDAVAPTFAGLTGVTLDPVNRSAVLTWSAASDNETPVNEIVYDLYQADTPLGQKFEGAPLSTSTPGATSMTVDALLSRRTLYWIVRARDKAGNSDANKAEQSGTTKTSFALDVQPMFTANCAVVGCHVSGAAAGGMVLSPSFAYAQIVSVKSGQQPAVADGPLWTYRVEPGNHETSFLYRKIAPLSEGLKISGSAMPAPATGNALSAGEVAIVRDWINEGANKN